MSTRDPVCGEELEEATAAASSEHDGNVFYFCSESCQAQFEAEPERYIGDALAERRSEAAPG
jgi:Cu+-exporting ATPase